MCGSDVDLIVTTLTQFLKNRVFAKPVGAAGYPKDQGRTKIFVDTYEAIRINSVFMKKIREIPRPTESEVELLTILWNREKATVRELFQEVNKKRPVVYTGVLKLLQIMTEKRLVVRDKTERAHVYRAAVERADTERQFVRDLSERFFAGSSAQLALRALEMETATDEELDEIRKLLKRKKS